MRGSRLKNDGGQIVLDVARGRGDDVKVVEQPFGGRRRRLAARASSASARVGRAQRPHVVVETAQVRTPAVVRPPAHGEQRRQAPGVLFEQLDTKQLDAAMRLELGRIIDRDSTAHPTVPPRS